MLHLVTPFLEWLIEALIAFAVNVNYRLHRPRALPGPPLSPLEKLPSRILIQILQHVVDVRCRKDRFSCRVEAQSLMAISRTSSRLRAIAIDHGVLWGQILQPDLDSLEEFRTIIQRANGAPLYLTSSLPTEFDAERVRVWDLALEMVSQCEGVFLQFDVGFVGRDLRPIGQLLRQPMPRLTMMSLRGIDDRQLRRLTSTDEELDAFPFINAFTKITKIRTLSLWTAPVGVLSLSQPAFRDLTDLYIRQEAGEREHKLSAAQWLGIFHSLPKLQVVALTHAIRVPPYVVSLIPSTADCPRLGGGALPELRSMAVEGNLYVHTELLNHLPISPNTFTATLLSETSPESLDFGYGHDRRNLVRHVTSLIERFPRLPGRHRIWSLSFEEKAFSITLHDDGHPRRFNLDVRVARPGAYHTELDEALSNGLTSVTLCANVLSTVEYVSISMTNLHRESPFPRSIPLLRHLFSTLHRTHSLYLGCDILPRGHASRLLQPASIQEQRYVPFPSVDTIHIDSSTFFDHKALACLVEYLAWRHEAGQGFKQVKWLVVWVPANTPEMFQEAVYGHGLYQRIKEIKANNQFKQAIKGGRVALMRHSEDFCVGSRFHRMNRQTLDST